MSGELQSLYTSLRKCLELRDKYMVLSRQRLGDNPRDHDESFTGLDDDLADVVGVRPDADYSSSMKPKRQFPRWKIYPVPPPPHWHFKEDAIVAQSEEKKTTSAKQAFDFSKCEIPSEDTGRVFSVDERGVYQIYSDDDCEPILTYQYLYSLIWGSSAEQSKPLYEVPTLRDYFVDLDYLLGVIADGPTKSFAFRRLKYLSNKWSMYSLLYEYEEIADMKVCNN